MRILAGVRQVGQQGRIIHRRFQVVHYHQRGLLLKQLGQGQALFLAAARGVGTGGELSQQSVHQRFRIQRGLTRRLHTAVGQIRFLLGTHPPNILILHTFVFQQLPALLCTVLD